MPNDTGIDVNPVLAWLVMRGIVYQTHETTVCVVVVITKSSVTYANRDEIQHEERQRVRAFMNIYGLVSRFSAMLVPTEPRWMPAEYDGVTQGFTIKQF